jgi:hypothetical protein
MDTWTITAADENGERGTVATVHDKRSVALARGCEAILDGHVGVQVEGTFSTYPLIDPASA